MRGLDWLERAVGIKRRISRTLSRAARLVPRGHLPAPSTSAQSGIPQPASVLGPPFGPHSGEGASAGELPSPESTPDTRVPTGAAEPSDPAPELEVRPAPLPDRQPTAETSKLPVAGDQPGATDECLVGMFAASAAYAANPNADDEKPCEAEVPACLAPDRSDQEDGARLPEAPHEVPEAGPVGVVVRILPKQAPLALLPEPELVPPQRIVALADSENVTAPIGDTLRYAGIFRKNGKLRRKVVSGLQIVHTGDMLLKHAPDPSVSGYWRDLGEDVDRLGGELVLLAGNHELEIWSCLQRGQRLGMKRRRCDGVEAFISNLKLFHVSGSVMFIHGYPTLNFLRDLKLFCQRSGLSVDRYNDRCFRPALKNPNRLAHFRYLGGRGARKLKLHDVENPGSYYRSHGKEVAALLRHFGVEQVIHGHRPERSGVQADYEFRRWLPGIRMIGNDTQLRERGLGGVVIRKEPDVEPEILMLNTRAAGKDQRKAVREALCVESGRKPNLPVRDVPRPSPSVAAREGNRNQAIASAA